MPGIRNAKVRREELLDERRQTAPVNQSFLPVLALLSPAGLYAADFMSPQLAGLASLALAIVEYCRHSVEKKDSLEDQLTGIINDFESAVRLGNGTKPDAIQTALKLLGFCELNPTIKADFEVHFAPLKPTIGYARRIVAAAEAAAEVREAEQLALEAKNKAATDIQAVTRRHLAQKKVEIRKKAQAKAAAKEEAKATRAEAKATKTAAKAKAKAKAKAEARQLQEAKSTFSTKVAQAKQQVSGYLAELKSAAVTLKSMQVKADLASAGVPDAGKAEAGRVDHYADYRAAADGFKAARQGALQQIAKLKAEIIALEGQITSLSSIVGSQQKISQVVFYRPQLKQLCGNLFALTKVLREGSKQGALEATLRPLEDKLNACLLAKYEAKTAEQAAAAAAAKAAKAEAAEAEAEAKAVAAEAVKTCLAEIVIEIEDDAAKAQAAAIAIQCSFRASSIRSKNAIAAAKAATVPAPAPAANAQAETAVEAEKAQAETAVEAEKAQAETAVEAEKAQEAKAAADARAAAKAARAQAAGAEERRPPQMIRAPWGHRGEPSPTYLLNREREAAEEEAARAAAEEKARKAANAVKSAAGRLRAATSSRKNKKPQGSKQPLVAVPVKENMYVMTSGTAEVLSMAARKHAKHDYKQQKYIENLEFQNTRFVRANQALVHLAGKQAGDIKELVEFLALTNADCSGMSIEYIKLVTACRARHTAGSPSTASGLSSSCTSTSTSQEPEGVAAAAEATVAAPLATPAAGAAVAPADAEENPALAPGR
jgi:hypothetical protein